uniref:Orf 1 protein n=1 Tax=Bacillus subtilis TaxID=1423 RepID=A2NWP3_BACIU|nr:hypothetical 14.4K protein (aroA region) - Bacillus subtilis [Bacillus subtilis]CAA46761.1 orf 1 [Bacillus subtilis subsp. subtilis str. 168]
MPFHFTVLDDEYLRAFMLDPICFCNEIGQRPGFLYLKIVSRHILMLICKGIKLMKCCLADRACGAVFQEDENAFLFCNPFKFFLRLNKLFSHDSSSSFPAQRFNCSACFCASFSSSFTSSFVWRT